MLETLKKVTLSEGDRVDDGSRHGRLRLEWNPGDGSRGSRWTFLLKGNRSLFLCAFSLCCGLREIGFHMCLVRFYNIFKFNFSLC